MTPLDPERTGRAGVPPIPGSAGSRPIPVSSQPKGPLSSVAAGGSNRPIPLKTPAKTNLPEAYEEDEEEQEEHAFKELIKNAPAWLVSTVFHMLLLIVLGLLAVAGAKKAADLEVEVAYSEPDLGKQLEDASVLEGDSPVLINADDEKVITPDDLAPVDDPLASPIDVGDLQLGTGISNPLTGPQIIEGAPIGLALSGRQAGSKEVLKGRYGANKETSAAVESGLAWLAKQQRADGLWSITGPYKDGGTFENNVAATAMALLAFQGDGNTHRTGPYSQNVTRGWTALLKLQGKDGLFSGVMADRNQLLYAHAQATIALCELYGMTNDSRFRTPAERAIAYALAVQDPTLGGWRYTPGQDSDTSVTGWFVMALQSARMARLEVPAESLQRVMQYLDSAALEDGRRYGYWQKMQPTNAVAAEGLLCRQYLGWPQDDPRLVEGISTLVKTAPIQYGGGLNHDVYYWYYATQAAHHMEGKIWNDWNKVMRQVVPAQQVRAGSETGSWNPQGDVWGNSTGRLYVTCLSIYMLEVYYRHLPIYSGYKAFGNPVKPPPVEGTEPGVGKSPEPETEAAPVDTPAAKNEVLEAPSERPAAPSTPPLEKATP